MSSDPFLKRWYRIYRTKYFSNALPESKEVDIFYADLPDLHGDCETDDDPPEMDEYRIRVDNRYRTDADISRLVLLHEMAHMHVWPYEGHGEKFQQEMLRLAFAGAFRRLW